jgi:hypothetical protein
MDVRGERLDKPRTQKRAARTIVLGIDRDDEMVYILPIASKRMVLVHAKT